MLRPERRARAILAHAASAAVSAFIVTSSLSFGAAAHTLRVRGTGVLQANATNDAEGVELRGSVRDDAGRPIADAKLSIRLLRTVGGGSVPLTLPQACPPTQLIRAESSDSALVEADPTGQFCVRLRQVSGGAVEVSLQAGSLYEPSTILIPIDETRRSLTLGFSPEPPPLQLDRASHAVFVDSRVHPPFRAEHDVDSIPLELLFSSPEGPEKIVATLMVRPGERAQFEVLSQSLAEPGPGQLTVRFAGSDLIQPAERSVIAPRTARVVLSLASAPPELDPDEGAELLVSVTSVAGPVATGSVEARVGDEPLGVGPVVSGSARVRLHPVLTRQPELAVQLRYLPSEPWWLPGNPVSVALPVAAPGAWLRLPWILGAFAVALWLFNAWRRPRPAKRSMIEPHDKPTGRPRLDVIETDADGTGWQGVILDAHEGVAIVAARLVIRSPTFEGDGMVIVAETDSEGKFALAFRPEALREGARLEVHARWHGSLERQVPPCGTIRIQLVSRRRLLLERLVEWARRRGRPWAFEAEPTPGRIARVARRRSSEDIAVWAEAVEEAAYGARPPDAEQERQVRDREPNARATQARQE